MKIAYKLFQFRKRNCTFGSLFINRKAVIPVMTWVKAKNIRTPGFAFRPGWHACQYPNAPHLSRKDRVWCLVSLRGIKKHHRPVYQGGLWYTAKWMRIDKVLWGLY